MIIPLITDLLINPQLCRQVSYCVAVGERLSAGDAGDDRWEMSVTHTGFLGVRSSCERSCSRVQPLPTKILPPSSAVQV